jgi:hypothetical protein
VIHTNQKYPFFTLEHGFMPVGGPDLREVNLTEDTSARLISPLSGRLVDTLLPQEIQRGGMDTLGALHVSTHRCTTCLLMSLSYNSHCVYV